MTVPDDILIQRQENVAAGCLDLNHCLNNAKGIHQQQVCFTFQKLPERMEKDKLKTPLQYFDAREHMHPILSNLGFTDLCTSF
jgi:hypothetical protein